MERFKAEKQGELTGGIAEQVMEDSQSYKPGIPVTDNVIRHWKNPAKHSKKRHKLIVPYKSIHPSWHFSGFVASQSGVKMDCFKVCTISFTEHSYNFEDVFFFYCEANNKKNKLTKNLSLPNCPPPGKSVHCFDCFDFDCLSNTFKCFP
ncbi:hypothetical protein XENORESO_012927 [Xenotaenia resolanae]|uniref:Uncharacterized protein n=1 Tax=Xenotaenia resolanae TaxID=208358 RepID=A0ABV0VML7_9TELE